MTKFQVFQTNFNNQTFKLVEKKLSYKVWILGFGIWCFKSALVDLLILI